MRLAVMVQARAGSSRLPSKVLAEVKGAPVLMRMLQRVRAAQTPFHLVLITTTEPEDDSVAAIGDAAGITVFRGHPTDLLDRHYQAALAHRVDAVVKIPSDCPLIDPAAIDRVLEAFLAEPSRFDYMSNLHPATWPDGNDVEVVTFTALETAWKEAARPYEREHTTPFLWDQPKRFRIGNVAWDAGLDYSMSHRFTLDYAEDLAFVRAIYAALYRPERPVFSLSEILALLARRPELATLNRRYAGVNWYRHHLADLRTVTSRETRFGAQL